jgi:hypothetical protein
MKIKDIIREAADYKGASGMEHANMASLPDAHIWPELDNSSGYKAYRFGVAMAGLPNNKMDVAGPTGLKMVTIGYTQAERDILDAAAKTMGTPKVRLSTQDSGEAKDTDKVSPVAKPKRNKYGV